MSSVTGIGVSNLVDNAHFIAGTKVILFLQYLVESGQSELTPLLQIVQVQAVKLLNS